MRISILGAGWYGCHIAVSLLQAGYDVTVHDREARVFAGASGSNPARLHLGFHYPRSAQTRRACQNHVARFMEVYGDLTRAIPVNIYAVAAERSLLDFGTYRKVLAGEVEFVTIDRPEDMGLMNIEGALLTGERHIVIDEARRHFETMLAGRLDLGNDSPDPSADIVIDCTFCARDSERIDRFEPCVTVLLEGPTDRAITVMDGPFPSVYPWKEDDGLSSLTSAVHTPISKECRTWREARSVLDGQTAAGLRARAGAMMAQICEFYPAAGDLYRVVDYKLSIRAMPRSAADARLVDIIQADERSYRVRAGKIDAIFSAHAGIENLLKLRFPAGFALL